MTVVPLAVYASGDHFIAIGEQGNGLGIALTIAASMAPPESLRRIMNEDIEDYILRGEEANYDDCGARRSLIVSRRDDPLVQQFYGAMGGDVPQEQLILL